MGMCLWIGPGGNWMGVKVVWEGFLWEVVEVDVGECVDCFFMTVGGVFIVNVVVVVVVVVTVVVTFVSE